MIRYQEALQTIQSVIKPLPVHEVSWREAYSLTLAKDIRALEPVPLYDNSAMDGFAVQAEDTKGASESNPVALHIIENIYAGPFFPQSTLQSGQAAKIMTGAPIPKGADAVVMIEKTRLNGQSIEIMLPVSRGENIRAEAEEITRGSVILPKGMRISSAELGLLASQGIQTVPVHQNPIVAVLPTGNELVEPDEKTEAAQIRNVNGYTLQSELSSFGCGAFQLGIGRDDPEALKELIQAGLEQADVLLTSGGVSMGDKDFLPAVLQEIGITIHFHKVSVKPGKPLLFGDRDGKYVFGLPGNVVSTMASYHLFVKPALRLLAGRIDWRNPSWYVRVGLPLQNPGNQMNFIRCYLNHSPNGLPIAFPTGKQGSGMMSSMVAADGFMVIPADVVSVEEHQVVEFIPMRCL